MFDIERFLEERLNPIYKIHYALWVYWWPLWRSISGRSILRKWEQLNLVQEGQTILDYGCGTGDFTIQAARTVSTRGKVYALDYFSRQLEIVKELHRVLRREWVLAIQDGMRERVLNYSTGLFSLTGRDGKFLRFTKIR